MVICHSYVSLPEGMWHHFKQGFKNRKRSKPPSSTVMRLGDHDSWTMVDHACHRPSTTVLRIYPQKEQLGKLFMALQKLILGPNQKQMGLTLGVYIYICICVPNGHFMPLFMAIFMAYTPPHSHWMRDTMIKVIWRLPGRQVASRQGIEKRDPIDESWVFDKENLHITVATKLKLILNLIRQADEADHVDTPWQCDRHQLDSFGHWSSLCLWAQADRAP